jgi:hypothetical protein
LFLLAAISMSSQRVLGFLAAANVAARILLTHGSRLLQDKHLLQMSFRKATKKGRHTLFLLAVILMSSQRVLGFLVTANGAVRIPLTHRRRLLQTKHLLQMSFRKATKGRHISFLLAAILMSSRRVLGFLVTANVAARILLVPGRRLLQEKHLLQMSFRKATKGRHTLLLLLAAILMSSSRRVLGFLVAANAAARICCK